MSPKKGAVVVAGGPAARTVPTEFQDPISIGVNGSILINTAKLGSPDNVYDADFAWLAIRHGAVSIWFGKESVDQSETLRSRLELRYPAEAFVRHFWQNSREFHSKMNELLQGRRDSERDNIKPEQMKAERDASMWVNFDYMARTGTQAALDFFHLPPSGVARFVSGMGSAGLVLTAKVRILTTVYELNRLLNSAESIAEQMKKQLPASIVVPEDEEVEQEIKT